MVSTSHIGSYLAYNMGIQLLNDHLNNLQKIINENRDLVLKLSENETKTLVTEEPVKKTFVMKSEGQMNLLLKQIEKFDPINFPNIYLINNKIIWDFNKNEELFTFGHDNNYRMDNWTCNNNGYPFFIYDYPFIYYFTPVSGTDYYSKNIRIYKYADHKITLHKTDNIKLDRIMEITRINNELVFHNTWEICHSNNTLNVDKNITNNLVRKYNFVTLKTIDMDAIVVIGQNKIVQKIESGNNNSGIPILIPYLVNDQIMFCMNRTHYIIYDVVNNIIVEKISHDWNGIFDQHSNIIIVHPMINFCDNKIIIVHKDKTEFFVLKDAEEVAKENECVVCFKHTDKNHALFPCGHTQYCGACITKIVEKKQCCICKSTVSETIKIFK